MTWICVFSVLVISLLFGLWNVLENPWKAAVVGIVGEGSFERGRLAVSLKPRRVKNLVMKIVKRCLKISGPLKAKRYKIHSSNHMYKFVEQNVIEDELRGHSWKMQSKEWTKIFPAKGWCLNSSLLCNAQVHSKFRRSVMDVRDTVLRMRSLITTWLLQRWNWS